jgi:hypothetical protein
MLAGVLVPESARQSIAADTKTFNWTDNTVVTIAEDVPPCHFTNVTTFPVGMVLRGGLYAHSGSDFEFFAARNVEKAPREPFLQKSDFTDRRKGQNCVE